MTSYTRRARFEMRFKSGNLMVRTYISYADDGDEHGYLGLFGNVSLLTSRFGKLELWSNLGRMRNDRIEYCYMYLRNEQTLTDNLHFIVKLSDSYSRTHIDRHKPVLSLQLRASL